MAGKQIEIGDNGEVVQILLVEYERLLKRDEILSKLEGAGVDNWEGYDLAFED